MIYKDKDCQIDKICTVALYTCYVKEQREKVVAGFYLPFINISLTIYNSQVFYI